MEKYKPIKSTRKDKKYMVLTDNGIVHFGQKGIKDFRQHGNKKKQKSYCNRAKGIKDKNGNLTYKNKNTANFWSRSLLWNC